MRPLPPDRAENPDLKSLNAAIVTNDWAFKRTAAPVEDADSLIFGTRPDIEIGEASLACAAAFKVLPSNCTLYGLDPVRVIVGANQRIARDTFHNRFVRVIDEPEFRGYALPRIERENTPAERGLEAFFGRFQIVQQLSDIGRGWRDAGSPWSSTSTCRRGQSAAPESRYASSRSPKQFA